MKKKIVVKRKLRSKKIFRRSASASQVDYILQSSRSRNPSWQSRCGCNIFPYSCQFSDSGQSFMTIRNQTSKAIRVRLNLYGREFWDRGNTFDEKWSRFLGETYRIFDSGIIQPGATGSGYFYNNTRRQRGGRTIGNGRGTLGLQVHDPRTYETIYRALWFEQPPNLGDLWLRCGHDYTFTFYEALIQAGKKRS